MFLRIDGREPTVLAGVALVVSVPLMIVIAPFAAFAFGLGIWFVPMFIGMVLLPQGALGGAISSEFDGAYYGLVVFGSLQNACIVWIVAKWLDSRLK